MAGQLVRIDGAMRVQPRVPVTAMKTYSLKAPLATHFRPASCDEVDCPNYLHGWKVVVLDETDPVWIMRMEYFRNKLDPRCDRRYREYRDEHGSLVFEFTAGQTCFLPHQITLERDPIYLTRGGDARGNPTGQQRIHVDADDWIDDFGEHQERIAESTNRG